MTRHKHYRFLGLNLLWHICNDWLGPRLENELLLDKGCHRVGGGGRISLAVGFHGYQVVVVMAGGVLRVTRELGEDSERLLQFDHFTIQDVMPDY